MDRSAVLEQDPADAVLAAWRHKAVNVFAAVSAVAFLPAVLLMLTGGAPPHGWPCHLLVTGAYLISVVCTVLHRSNHRTRAWALLAGMFVVAVVHLITIPHGPFGRALSALLPILAIVFLGTRAAWWITASSVVLVIFGPLLQQVPVLVRVLTLEPAGSPTPGNVVLYEGAALAALLLGQMMLLARFHVFLMNSLNGFQTESAERALACRRLEREMLERHRLEYQLSRAADEERRRLGAEIHDGVCQQITAALLRCQSLGRRLARGAALSTTDFEIVSSLLAGSIDEAHNVARGLCPLDSSPESLLHALRTLVNRTREISSVSCEFVHSGNPLVPDQETAQHLYRIAQEAISNALRHANPSRISVELHLHDGALSLLVQDDGSGLSPEPSSSGLGLRLMAHRASVLGGALTLEPAPGGGTRVACRIPLHPSVPHPLKASHG